MYRLLFSLATCILVTTQVIAGPRIGQLRESDLDGTQFCQFSATQADEGIVLELRYGEAKMQLHDRLVRLSVTEKKCLRNCVGPGHGGVRVFQLSGSGVRATLTKQVTCAQDAEVCSGLQEGNAKLAVSTSAGQTTMSIWGAYCDM